MQLSITFRHMPASSAVRDSATERLERIGKYFRREPLAAHAVFSVERNHNHTAELSLTLPTGLVVQARETTEDMYSSIDLAAARLERQVRKWKDKIRDHKPHAGPGFPARRSVLEAAGLEPAKPAAAGGPVPSRRGKERRAPEPPAPRAPPSAVNVIKEATFAVRSMRVEDAVMQMNLLGNDFLLFANTDGKGLSVVYRRKDGNYGLIETAARVPGM